MTELEKLRAQRAEARALLEKVAALTLPELPFPVVCLVADALHWLSANPEPPRAWRCHKCTGDHAASEPCELLRAADVLLMQRLLRSWRDLWGNEQPTWGRGLYDETHAALKDGSQAVLASPRAAAERAVLEAMRNANTAVLEEQAQVCGPLAAASKAELARRAATK